MALIKIIEENIFVNDETQNIFVNDETNPISIEIGNQGSIGPIGPAGPQGLPGWSFSYTHNQIDPLSSWTINHSLDRYPSVSVVDSANTEVIGNVIWQDSNTIIVEFDAPFGGKAYLN